MTDDRRCDTAVVSARVERIRAGREELISDEQLVKELDLESGEIDFSLLDDVQ